MTTPPRNYDDDSDYDERYEDDYDNWSADDDGNGCAEDCPQCGGYGTDKRGELCRMCGGSGCW
jgi:hypothetical protein